MSFVRLKDQYERDIELTETNQRMITEISHDLRTPLTTILLYTEMCILYNILVLYDKNIAQIPCFRVIFTNIYSDRPAVRGVDLLTFAIDDCIIDCEPVHIMNDAFWLL